jgi:hypothetical protein
MDAVALLLGQHARLHSSAVAPSEAGSMEDFLLGGIDDAGFRTPSVPGLNPVAWIFWHMARAEDVLANVVIGAAPQVWDEGWADRVRVDRRDIGTAMSAAEVTDVAAAVDLGALRAYRAAVGRRTREIVGAFGAEELDAIVPADGVERAREAGAFAPGAEWVEEAWHGTTLGFLLGRNLVTHNALHVGEAIVAGPVEI